MYVTLPSGCNILNSNNTIYNYTNNNRTRSTYIIYDGTAFLQSVQTSQTGYTYSGDCLSTGDLVYKPEVRVYFPIISFCLICAILLFIYNIFIKRLLP